MTVGALDDLLDGRPSRGARAPVTGTVVRRDSTGVYVVPLDDDTRHPIGPCRGGVRGSGDDATQLRRGTVVLVVFTEAGPWIANWDGA